MKLLATPFQQLVERRLWPVALVLVAALAAVPLLLGKDGEAPPAAVATAAPAGQGATEPIVSVADAARADTERKVLGSRKDPFRPAVKAKPAKKQAAATSTASAPGATQDAGGAASGGGSPSGGGSASGGAPTPPPGPTVPQEPVTPQEPKTVFELHSLSVAFGPSTGPLTKRVLERLKGLPGGRRPAVLYLGLAKDHKTAVFLVDATAKIQGDGRCEPTPEDCQTLRMRAGDVAFIDRPGGTQYELDLLKVHTKRTTDAIEAQASRLAEAEGGRRLLRRNIGRVGRYRYSSTRGHLLEVPSRGLKARASGTSVAVAG